MLSYTEKNKGGSKCMFFKKKYEVPKEIEDFNKFPADKEKLLCIGAGVSNHAVVRGVARPEYLKFYYTSKEIKNLQKYWLPMFGISNGNDARNLIESWISSNSYTSVTAPEVKAKIQKEIEKASKKSEMDGSSLLQSLENINDTGAFDIERLGYMTRVCFTLGLLTEEQAWHYLEQLYALASEHYNSWDDYIISYTNENTAQSTNWYYPILEDYLTIKKTKQNLFDKYPLGK